MAALNEELVFNRVDAAVRQTFRHGTAKRILLPAGTGLYKFTGYGLVGTRGGQGVSPWWCPIERIPLQDAPSLDETIAMAKSLGFPLVEFAREYLAVKHEWNTLGITDLKSAKLLRIRLNEATYGFLGRCQRMENVRGGLYRQLGAKVANSPFLAGGAYQLWIPNLTLQNVTSLGSNLIS